jgi:hypothetical protein
MIHYLLDFVDIPLYSRYTIGTKEEYISWLTKMLKALHVHSKDPSFRLFGIKYIPPTFDVAFSRNRATVTASINRLFSPIGLRVNTERKRINGERVDIYSLEPCETLTKMFSMVPTEGKFALYNDMTPFQNAEGTTKIMLEALNNFWQNE